MTENSVVVAPEVVAPTGARRWAIRIVYGLLSVYALLMSPGVILVLAGAVPDDRLFVATTTAFKLLALGAVVGLCFTAGRSVVALQALAVGLASWNVAALLSPEAETTGTWTMQVVILCAMWLGPWFLLSPQRRAAFRLRARPDLVLVGLAAPASGLLLMWAWSLRSLALDPARADLEQTLRFDLVGLGVVLSSWALFSALRPRGTVWPAVSTAVAGLYVAVWAVALGDAWGSMGRSWGLALGCWCLLFAARAAWLARPAGRIG